MKKLVINTRIVALAVLLVICVFSVAADDFGLDEKIGMVLQMLSSPWVKGIACIALIVECIGLITAGRQEPGMFRSHAGPLKVYPLDCRDHPLYGGGHYHQQVYFR
jgi:type IV secretory pathway VirB2 component (pilin)